MRFPLPSVASEPSAVLSSRQPSGVRNRPDTDGRDPATPFAALLDSGNAAPDRPRAPRDSQSDRSAADRQDRPDRGSETISGRDRSPSASHSTKTKGKTGTDTKSDSDKTSDSQDAASADETATAENIKPADKDAAAPDPNATTAAQTIQDLVAAQSSGAAPPPVAIAAAPAVDPSAQSGSAAKPAADKQDKDGKTASDADASVSGDKTPDPAIAAPAKSDNPLGGTALATTASDLAPSAAPQAVVADTSANTAPDADALTTPPIGAPHIDAGNTKSPRPQLGAGPADAAQDPRGQANGTGPADPQPADTQTATGKPDPARPHVEASEADVRVAADALKKAHPDAPAPHSDAASALKAGTDAVQNLGAAAQPGQSSTANAATATANGPTAGGPLQAQAAAIPMAGLAIEIASQAHAGKHHFDIRLDPPELGRIDVRLDVDSDGNVSSRLVVERADTLDLLKRDASQLERALQQAGLKTSDNALEFSLRQQTSGRENTPQQNAAQLIAPTDDPLPPEATRRGYGRLLGLGGGLDIRV